jgi:hypothetical protein
LLEPIVIPIKTPNAAGVMEDTTAAMLDASSGVITLTAGTLNNLAGKIVTGITGTNLALTPNAVIVTSGIVLQPPPDASGKVVPAYSTSNQLGVLFEFVIQPPPKAGTGSQTIVNPVNSNPLSGSSAAAAMAASGLWPAGYSRGIVPAREFVNGDDDAQKSAFRLASRGSVPPPRRVAADPSETGQLQRLFEPDQENGSVIRTQQTPAPPAPGPVQPAGGSPVTLPPGTTFTIPGTNQTVTIPNPTTFVMPNAAPTQAAQSLVVVPRTPPINVSVPVTNNPAPARRFGRLFRHQTTPATPQNPTRPPLLERLIGGA